MLRLAFAAILLSQANTTGPIRLEIKKGMTLSEIALQYYGTTEQKVLLEIKKANPKIKDVDMIYAGDTIVLPQIEGYSITARSTEKARVLIEGREPSYMRVARIGGDVKVVREAVPVPTNVFLGQALTNGDMLICKDSSSWIELTLPNGILIRVRGPAEFKIGELYKVNNRIQSKIELVEGAVYLSSSKLANSSIQIRAGQLNVVSRHTKFTVYNVGEKNLVKVFEGEVEVMVGDRRFSLKGGQSFAPTLATPTPLKLEAWDKWNISLDAAIVDHVPPVLKIDFPPSFLITNKTSVVIKGNTEPNATVFVNGVKVDLDATGNFQHSVELREGLNLIVVESRDLAGNSTISRRIVNVDLQPPMLVVSYPPESLITKMPTLKVIAYTEPGAKAVVNGEQAFVSRNGKIEHAVKLSLGENTVKVEVADSAGNTTVVEKTVILDVVPPRLEILSPERGLVTNKDSVDVVVLTESNAAVVIEGEPAEDLGEGKFHKVVYLNEGPNAIGIQAVDLAGNINSQFLAVTRDITPPAVTLTGLLAIDGAVTQSPELLVRGSTEPDVQIKVNGVEVDVSESGEFSTIYKLREGMNSITIEAIDAAGNKTVIKRRVLYVPQS